MAILAKGDGCIPSPTCNSFQFCKDGYNTANKLAWSTIHKDSPSVLLPPKLLKKEVTTTAPLTRYCIVNSVVEKIKNFVDNPVELTPRVKNINTLERKGLDWLKEYVRAGNIAITKADKGGSICVVKPGLLEEITMEKLNNLDLYRNLGTCFPVNKISSELLSLWSEGVEEGYVTSVVAKQVVGLTASHRPSTLDRFKPGEAYHYPLLKLHELKTEDIKPGCVPPCRLVTALDQSPTVRSDTYSDSAPLARDFCKDLVKDHTEVLQWLNYVETNKVVDENTVFLIINTDCLLELRLYELYDRIKKCGYPRKMLNDISNKVKSMPRNIQCDKKRGQRSC